MSITRPRSDAADTSWDEPTLKVALVARRLGVAPATLRTWARRYGLGPSSHTAGSHRHYSSEDMGRLLVMRRLTLEGVAPAEAARIALSRPPDDESGDLPGTGGAHGDQTGDTYGDPYGDRDQERARRAEVAQLAAAAAALDARRCSEVLDGALEAHGIVTTWTEVVEPVLEDLHSQWDRAAVKVDATPLLSDCVVNSVDRVVSVVGGAPKILLACAEDDDNAVGLYVLSAALWETGTPTRSLGARVPRETLAATARQTAPHATVVLAVRPVRDHDQLYGLPGVHPTMTVIATGPGWSPDLLPPSVAFVPAFDGLVRVLAAAG